MPHRHSQRKPHASEVRSRSTHRRDEGRHPASYNPHTNLTKLIEQDSPLQTHSQLVLMYGPFQTEMLPEAGQGVASWIKDCLHKHGLPSLVRFDYRRRAQIFRRDQFQPWLEPLMEPQRY